MPYIHARINREYDAAAADAFKSEMGKAITVFPGKSESWLMVGIEKCDLRFAGNDAPAAMVEISLFGRVESAAAGKMTAKVCDSMEKYFGIAADRVYVKYTPVEEWGWNGSDF